MNQILKDCVYTLGSDEEVEFIAMLGGMNDEDKKVFNLLHLNENDLDIQAELGLSKEAYKRIEDSVRKKVLIAVFKCILYTFKKSEEE